MEGPGQDCERREPAGPHEDLLAGRVGSGVGELHAHSAARLEARDVGRVRPVGEVRGAAALHHTVQPVVVHQLNPIHVQSRPAPACGREPLRSQRCPVPPALDADAPPPPAIPPT